MDIDVSDRKLWLVVCAGALAQIVLNVLTTGLTVILQGGSGAASLDPASTEASLGLLITLGLCLCSAVVSGAIGAAYVIVVGREGGLDVSRGLLGGAVTGALAGALAGVVGGCVSTLLLPLVLGGTADVNADLLLFGGLAVAGLIGGVVGIATAMFSGLVGGALLGGLGGGLAAAAVTRRR